MRQKQREKWIQKILEQGGHQISHFDQFFQPNEQQILKIGSRTYLRFESGNIKFNYTSAAFTNYWENVLKYISIRSKKFDQTFIQERINNISQYFQRLTPTAFIQFTLFLIRNKILFNTSISDQVMTQIGKFVRAHSKCNFESWEKIMKEFKKHHQKELFLETVLNVLLMQGNDNLSLDEDLKSNSKFQEKFLFYVLKNRHFSLLNKSLCEKNSNHLSKIWSNWSKEKENDESQKQECMAGIAAYILYNKNSDPFYQIQNSQSQIKNWKRAYQIYQSIETLINSEIELESDESSLKKIKGEDQFFNELFLWNFVQNFLKHELWNDEKIDHLKTQLKEKLPSWNFHKVAQNDASQENTLWNDISQCFIDHGMSKEKVNQLRNQLISQPSLEEVRDQLFALIEYSLLSIENNVANREKKIERLRILCKNFIKHFSKNLITSNQDSNFLKPLFECIKIYVKIMQRGLFLLLTQYPVYNQNESQDADIKKALQGLLWIWKEDEALSPEFDEIISDMEDLSKNNQDNIDEINQFWLFFMMENYFCHTFLREVKTGRLSPSNEIQFSRILEKRYFKKQKNENKDNSKWLEETKKKILKLKNNKDFQNVPIESVWEEVKQGILLKEKIYAVRPGSYQRFQIKKDLSSELLGQLEEILNQKISVKEIKKNNEFLSYFAHIMQNNPDLEKLTQISESDMPCSNRK